MYLTVKESRQGIMNVEDKIRQLPGAMFNDCLPLKHTFTDGFYMREIFIPKGTLLVSKIHKFAHPVFVLEGDISILSEEGVKRIKAPCSLISPVGAKRVGFAHEDTRWVTVHLNPSNTQEIEKLEETLIAKNFDELTFEENDFIEMIKESEGVL